MKKVLVVIMMLSIFINSQAQVSPTEMDYIKKSNRQKTVAWIAAGAGVVIMLVGGVFIATSDALDFYDDGDLRDLGVVILILGAVTSAVSIPLFISAAKNRKAAMELSGSFKIENRSYIQYGGLTKRPYPALALKFRLR